MSFAYALKVLCDVMFYFTIASTIGIVAGQTGLVPGTLAVIALCAFGYHFLSTKTEKWYKYLPVLGMPLAFLLAGSKLERILSVLPVLYACWYIWKRPHVPGYEEAQSKFYLCLKIAPVGVLIAVFSRKWAGIQSVVLPYFFMFLVLSVILLRMLRHDAETMAQTRFKVLNVSGIVAVVLVGWLLSAGWMLKLFRLIGTGIVQFILQPIFKLVLYIASGIMWVISLLIGDFEFDPESLNLSRLAQNMDLGSDVRQLVEEDGGQALTEGAWWDYFLIVLAVAALLLVAFLIFRALARRGRRMETNTFADVRETVKAVPEEKRDMRENRQQVRNYYRKFLKLCMQRGFEVTEFQDSKEIEFGTLYLFGGPAHSGLRDVYVRARYSSAEVTDEDVETARECYKQLKKDRR